MLLSLPSLALGAATLTPALVIFALPTAWYLTRGQLALGISVSLCNAALLWHAQRLPHGSSGTWQLAGWLTRSVAA